MSVISLFGLGYVGAVTMACLAEHGNKVIGVDVNPTKVTMVNQGRSPVIEAGLDDLLKKGVESGCIEATTDAARAVAGSEISIICVGTPSHDNGGLNLTYVIKVCEEIGSVLANKESAHVVIVRSTILPGTTENLVIPTLEKFSGKRAGKDFGVCFSPEFLREGSSISDFYNPPFTVIGAEDEWVVGIAKGLYAMIEAPVWVVPYKVSEILKYATNAFHALKVAFANEIGNICKQQNIDSHQVMEIFCQDTKLNISPAYLKPGFAFGGSCLPKDLRALVSHSRHLDLQLPVLESILPSNHQQIERAYRMIKETDSKRVGVLGFSFKAGTDDLRESPVVELIEHLIGKGYQVKVYDRYVSMANLQGANRAYIEREIPHIASLMADSIESVVESSEVIIIGNNSPEFGEVLGKLSDGQIMIDLVRVTGDHRQSNSHYRGISW
ncbi:MAG: nucleotide sugar dehydrogenase [Candidatus Methanosuratincola sp.]